MASIDRASTFDRVERVPLSRLDDTTVRAMCDAGYVDHATYVGIAQARGLRVTEVAALAGEPDRAFVVSVPSDVGADAVDTALGAVGGRIAGVFHHSAKGTLTLPSLNTRMQHQRPPEPHRTTVA